MSKVKFDWMFRLSNDESELEVWLNDGVSKIIEINHQQFYTNVTDILTEINVFQFVHRTKTNITPKSFDVLRKAYQIHESKKEIEEKGFKVIGYYVDRDGDETSSSDIFVAIDENLPNNNYNYYCPIGQHQQGDKEYLKDCKQISKEHYMAVSSHLYTPKDYL
jgi:hypothetical protein